MVGCLDIFFSYNIPKHLIYFPQMNGTEGRCVYVCVLQIVCVLHVKLFFSPIYTQHNQYPRRCLLQSRALDGRKLRDRDIHCKYSKQGDLAM